MALRGSHSMLIHEILDDLLTFRISRPGVSISEPIILGLETGGFSSLAILRRLSNAERPFETKQKQAMLSVNICTC